MRVYAEAIERDGEIKGLFTCSYQVRPLRLDKLFRPHLGIRLGCADDSEAAEFDGYESHGRLLGLWPLVIPRG